MKQKASLEDIAELDTLFFQMEVDDEQCFTSDIALILEKMTKKCAVNGFALHAKISLQKIVYLNISIV